MGRLGPFEENTIVVGDCLDIMAQMPDGCVDLVFADPPYHVGFKYGGQSDVEFMEIEAPLLVEELCRLSPRVLITTGMKRLADFAKMSPQWTLGWFKPGSTRQSGLRGFNTWEPIFFWGQLIRPVYQDAVRLPDIAHHADDIDFPCPKPRALMRWLIDEFSDGGHLIFDPFMGSGTTAVVADRLGRKFFGCDINPDYVEMALERLEKDRAGRQLSLL